MIYGTIYRSNLIRDVELNAKNLVEKYSESGEANEYRTLALIILMNKKISTPENMGDAEFENFFLSLIYSTNFLSPIDELLLISDGKSICGAYFHGQKYFFIIN